MTPQDIVDKFNKGMIGTMMASVVEKDSVMTLYVHNSRLELVTKNNLKSNDLSNLRYLLNQAKALKAFYACIGLDNHNDVVYN